MHRSLLAALPFLLAACAVTDVQGPPAPIAGPVLPAGGTLSPSGHLTVEEAPPAAWPSDPPPPPATLDTLARRTALGTEEERARAWEEANGPEDLQQEVQRLMQLLPQAEAGNFVQLRYVRDETSTRDPQPLLGVEVWFKRDAVATLAKYTSDPRIFARQGGLSEPEIEMLRQLWFDRLREVKSGWSASSDPVLGRLEIDVGLTEDRFRALAAERGWTWGDEVRITFASQQPPAFADPELARLVRIFARENTQSSIRLLALGTGRIIVRDGCFRLGSDEGAGPLAMFAYEAQLDRDAEGYLVVTSPESGGQYRIGEPGAWGGPNHVDEDWPDVRALRQLCGEGEIVNVASPQSLRSFGLPDVSWVLDYAQVKGLSYDDAWDEVIGCMARQERAGRTGLDAREVCITQFNRRR